MSRHLHVVRPQLKELAAFLDLLLRVDHCVTVHPWHIHFVDSDSQDLAESKSRSRRRFCNHLVPSGFQSTLRMAPGPGALGTLREACHANHVGALVAFHRAPVFFVETSRPQIKTRYTQVYMMHDCALGPAVFGKLRCPK